MVSRLSIEDRVLIIRVSEREKCIVELHFKNSLRARAGERNENVELSSL